MLSQQRQVRFSLQHRTNRIRTYKRETDLISAHRESGNRRSGVSQFVIELAGNDNSSYLLSRLRKVLAHPPDVPRSLSHNLIRRLATF